MATPAPAVSSPTSPSATASTVGQPSVRVDGGAAGSRGAEGSQAPPPGNTLPSCHCESATLPSASMGGSMPGGGSLTQLISNMESALSDQQLELSESPFGTMTSEGGSSCASLLQTLQTHETLLAGEVVMDDGSLVVGSWMRGRRIGGGSNGEGFMARDDDRDFRSASAGPPQLGWHCWRVVARGVSCWPERSFPSDQHIAGVS